MSTRTRGFASMPLEKRQDISRKGGQTAQAAGTAHRWSTEEARAAGKRSAARRQAKRDAEKAAAGEGSAGEDSTVTQGAVAG